MYSVHEGDIDPVQHTPEMDIEKALLFEFETDTKTTITCEAKTSADLEWNRTALSL